MQMEDRFTIVNGKIKVLRYEISYSETSKTSTLVIEKTITQRFFNSSDLEAVKDRLNQKGVTFTEKTLDVSDIEKYEDTFVTDETSALELLSSK